MKKIITFILLSSVFTGLVACSTSKVDGDYAGSQEDERRKRLGSLTGGGGLISFGGNKSSNKEKGNSAGIGINKYLWRATLDTISFMPLLSADPFGGVILTDWHEDNVKGTRFKLNVIINSVSLRSDAVKVSAFKQSFNDKLKTWSDAAIDGTIATQIENKILTRARQLKVRNQQSN